MKKVRPLDPVFLFICLFLPWRFINTYFLLDRENILISRYYAEKDGSFHLKKDIVNLREIIKYGFSEEFGSIQEPIPAGGYGVYISQEIQFVLDGDAIIPWNVRPYTRKQIKKLADYIYSEHSICPSDKLKKSIRF